MKKLFVLFAVSTLIFSCGQEKKCESQCDSTKTCCKDSTMIDSTKAVVDSVSVDSSDCAH
jgi:hypothetical protein